MLLLPLSSSLGFSLILSLLMNAPTHTHIHTFSGYNHIRWREITIIILSSVSGRCWSVSVVITDLFRYDLWGGGAPLSGCLGWGYIGRGRGGAAMAEGVEEQDGGARKLLRFVAFYPISHHLAHVCYHRL